MQKKKILKIGLSETQNLLKNPPDKCMVFLINDNDHEHINQQLVIACKQQNLPHFILPRFLKKDLSEMFGVKRITCFGLDLSQSLEIPDQLCKFIGEFNNNFESAPDLNKFRHADDSMFNQSKLGHTLIKKWWVVKNPKNNKKVMRS